MIPLLLMVYDALDAERAFAADARANGQWTAFRRWAAPDAIMFGPGPVRAATWLKDRVDPPRSVTWRATASYRSCDGGTAIDGGQWRRPDGSTGWFATIWRRQADGHWRWTLDLGDGARPQLSRSPTPLMPVKPFLRTAACPMRPIPLDRRDHRLGESDDGGSADGSLQFHWWSFDSKTSLSVLLWTGTRLDDVLFDAAGP